MENLMKRYNQNEQEIIKAFFNKCAKTTRKNGKISDNVKIKQLESWQKYEVKAVIEGLKIYNRINITAAQDEKYALGIIRNKDKELKRNDRNIKNDKAASEGERLAKLAREYTGDGDNIECDF